MPAEQIMLTRRAKATFYLVATPIMTANGWIYRKLRAPRRPGLKVHLGPGQRNYLPGWVNIDANMFTGKCDVWADLRNPLPLRDGTVRCCYSHHVIEHLPNLRHHFQDVFRCLEPGGIYRVGGPNGDTAMHKFVEGDARWFSSYPDDRRSIGGRFENFIFCRQEHLTILTQSYLEELLTDAGFVDIRKCLPVRETNYPEYFGECLAKEHEADYVHPHTLIVEARKPAAPGPNGR